MVLGREYMCYDTSQAMYVLRGFRVTTFAVYNSKYSGTSVDELNSFLEAVRETKLS
jgi:hypothetical protein